MRVALYARVSTREQTAENQIQDLRRYCASRGWEIVKEFTDAGISGAKDDRPALRELMDFSRKRLADVVLVWRFDRLARSLKHLLNTLSELNEIGIHFVSYSEALDTTTSQGRLVFGVLGAIAEFERDLIRERVMSGLRRARAAGATFGRPRRISTLAAFDELRQLRAQGRSLREIEAETGVPISTLSRVFHKPPAESMSVSDGEQLQK